jgi:ribosomal protein L14E/L6E/L27E
MDRFEVGMLARSKAGHDKGHVYVIMKEENAYVYLVDGSLRTLDRPKKKKKMHVQIILQKHETSEIDDVKIKRILKLFDKETGRI